MEKGQQTAGDLAVEPRRLRQRAQRVGSALKISKVAAATKVSQQSIYAYLAGTTVPPPDIFDDLLEALGAIREERIRLWQLLDAVEESRRTRQGSHIMVRQTMDGRNLSAYCQRPRTAMWIVPSG